MNIFEKARIKKMEWELNMLAGNKPLGELTDKEKEDIVRKWALLREVKKEVSPTTVAIVKYASYFCVMAVCLAVTAWAVKWLLTIIGVLP